MDNILQSPADHFIPQLATFSDTEMKSEITSPKRLLMASSDNRGKRLDTAWAPFEHINRNARVVIVGITPGRQQMVNALRECRRLLQAGATPEDALAAAKVYASFSGPMRSNLIAMLDDIGVQRLLGVQTAADLWGPHSHLVHFTSALRYPVFVDGANYSGTPDMLRTHTLRVQLETWFAKEMLQIPDAIFVPLGPKVGAALAHVASQIGIADDRLLTGLPHPSGASGERIAYFLGRKAREALSTRTNADRLDAAKATLVTKMTKLGA